MHGPKILPATVKFNPTLEGVMSTSNVAVITGASRGIGRAVARAVAEEGYRVALLARHAEALEAFRHELESEGREVLAIAGDVGRAEDVERLFAAVDRTWRRVDVLVNNAGIGVFAPLEHLRPEDFDRVLKTNLYGPYYCARAAVPLMRQSGGGYIINIGSLAGVNAFPSGSVYCASKSALRAMFDCLMLEVRHDNIKVTTIAPGSVDTEFAGQDVGQAWKIRPDDIASTVVFLLRMDARTLNSYIEMRPTRPPRKS